MTSTGLPGSRLHIWPSPSAVEGHNAVFVWLWSVSSVHPPRPPPLLPSSHRCSQCHPTKAPADKTVFCVLQQWKGRKHPRGHHGNRVASFDSAVTQIFFFFWWGWEMFVPSIHKWIFVRTAGLVNGKWMQTTAVTVHLSSADNEWPQSSK